MGVKQKIEKVPAYNSLVRPLHYAQALVAAVKNNFPARGLHVIAVTGTNGKTTTCLMIWKMLQTAGYKVGVMTTVGWGVDEIEPQVEHMTTERVGVLNERMRKIREAGAEFLVLEVTSHALMQSRTLGVPIEIAVFTNLTHEHLDYHGTFENYRAAKMRLFEAAEYGVVNADDPSAEFFVSAMPKKAYSSGDIITYGIERGDLRATDVKLGANGVEYACGDMKIKTQIAGKFNVYNSLAAVAVGERLGLDARQIENGIAALGEVNGRMQAVEMGQPFTVLVDYAHTPDALEKVFESVRGVGGVKAAGASEASANGAGVGEANTSGASEASGAWTGGAVPGQRIIAVHGGAGRRDETTRPERGMILGKNSDIVIITEDDSRDEDPQKIAEMFVAGATQVGKVLQKDLLVELDRAKAIELALRLARPNDLVLLLGKGHERTILRADGPHDLMDAKVAREVLQKMGYNSFS